MRRYSYWPYKEPLARLLKMEKGNGVDAEGARMSRHVFAGQYMQSPRAIGGNIIKGHWFPRYKILPAVRYRKIYADTAQKTKERNDRSVFLCAGMCVDGKARLLDLIMGKWEAPELQRRALEFWNKHKAMTIETAQIGLPYLVIPSGSEKNHLGQLREMMVEDKSSGTGLIQSIRFQNALPIKAIERVTDKLTRVMDVVPYWESQLFELPELAPFTSDFVSEGEAFTADDTHQYDDQIDAAVDMTVDRLASGNKLKMWEMNASTNERGE